MNPYIYGQLIYDKKGETLQWGKGSLFNKWCQENWTVTCKGIKPDYFLTPYTKINSKQIKNLNVRPETIKLLEDNIVHSLTCLSNIFLAISPQARETKAKIFFFFF